MSMVEDVSQILRRKCPSEKEIVEASKSLEYHADNPWFMEGEEDLDMDHNKWDTSDENLATGRKRRKLSAEDPQGNPPQSNDLHNLARTERPAFFESPTMQNRAAFSCQGSGGFTSAAVQLHCITEAGYEIRQTKLSRERPRLPPSRRGALHGEDNANLGHKLKGKSNLLSLWGTKSTQSQRSNSIAKSRLEPKGSYNASAQTNKDQVSQKGESRKHITSTQDKTQVTYPKKTLNVIPPGLANHELHSRPHQSRHRPVENDQHHKHYLFLSSSPPPINELPPQQSNIDSDVGATLSTKASLKKSVLDGETSSGNNRPASTFHTTSVAEVKEGANHSKKTLGIRRSMTGWTCRGNQRFSIPGKPQGI